MKLFFTDDEFQSSYRSSVVQFPDFSMTFEVSHAMTISLTLSKQ